MRTILALAAALSATVVLARDLPDPAPVVAAERAFAADTARIGVARGFVKHSTTDAFTIRDKIVLVRESHDANAPESPPNPSLVWFPTWAGMARSGDLGFTSGPVDIGGKRLFTYFTVWKKQPDGGWKWIFDGGVPSNPGDHLTPETPLTYLPTSAIGSTSPQTALADVAAAEATLATSAATDQKAAHLAALAPDGRLHVAPHPPGGTFAEFSTLLDSYPKTFRFAPLGGQSSNAGDMVFTYGTAEWAREGVERKGYYIRIWQKRAEGWELVFAQVLAAGPPPTPPTGTAPGAAG